MAPTTSKNTEKGIKFLILFILTSFYLE